MKTGVETETTVPVPLELMTQKVYEHFINCDVLDKGIDIVTNTVIALAMMNAPFQQS